MRYLPVFIILMFLGQVAADDFDEAVRIGKQAGLEAVVTAALERAETYIVKVESDDEMQRFYRGERLILARAVDSSVYRLQGPTGIVGRVVTDKPESPRMLLEGNIDLGVFIEMKPDGGVLLEYLDIKSGYYEAYELTAETVQPIDANEYFKAMVELEGYKAFFDSVGESLGLDPERD